MASAELLCILGAPRDLLQGPTVVEPQNVFSLDDLGVGLRGRPRFLEGCLFLDHYPHVGIAEAYSPLKDTTANL